MKLLLSFLFFDFSFRQRNLEKYSLAESDCDAGRCCWEGRPRAGWATVEWDSDVRGFVSCPFDAVVDDKYAPQSFWKIKNYEINFTHLCNFYELTCAHAEDE